MAELKTREITNFNDFISGVQEFLNNIPVTDVVVNQVPVPTDDVLCGTDGIVTEANVAFVAFLLDELAELIEDEFIDGPDASDLPLGFRAQIERLVCIIRLLANRVRAISCPEFADGLDILYEIFCVLVEILAILVGIVIKLLVFTTDLAENETFFECLACKLIEEITALEEATKELSCLIVALLSADFEDCTPCYVATKAGKRPRVNVTTKNVCSCKKH